MRLKETASGLERSGDRWRIGLAEGGGLDADAVVITGESHRAARLLRYADPALAQLVGEIPYASSATVSLGYARDAVPHPLDGFGFVVPRVERRPILACTFSSVKYSGRAPQGHVLLRIFMGGALDEGVLGLGDAALATMARHEIARALGVTAMPVLTRVSRHPASMAQYRVGHVGRVEAIERGVAAHRGLAVAGSAYRGVGVADCIRSGETAVERLLAAPA